MSNQKTRQHQRKIQVRRLPHKNAATIVDVSVETYQKDLLLTRFGWVMLKDVSPFIGP